MCPVTADGRTLSLDDVVAVAHGAPAVLPDRIAEAMRASVALKDELVAAGQPVYGVTTGFGDSVTRQIGPAKTTALQQNLILYHMNGTGPPAGDEVVRATLLIRANCLARGNSGVRPEIAARLLDHLRLDVLPVVPERGSVGASGDLVPLSHVAATVLGEGWVRHRGVRRPAADVLAEVGLPPAELRAKEGLALINGTAFSAAFAALATAGARRVARVAELCTAMTSEAVLGNRGHFHPFVHEHKPHPGQVASAGRVWSLLADSRLAMDHGQVVGLAGGLDGRLFAESTRSIQDRYSIRCAPHVIGVLHDTVEWVRRWVEIEINSSNDNPLFDVSSGQVHSGGNFYGGHLAQAMDALKVAVAGVADLLDRQLEQVVDEKFNRGLPPNLVPAFDADEWRAGLHHGFKGMQLACSSITAEALKTSTPAGLFSRSTEAHNQDKVSMSALAARDARTVVELTEEVAAIHLLALCQALDLRGVELSAPPVRAVHALVRAEVPTLRDDRAMAGDIAAVLRLLRAGALEQRERGPDVRTHCHTA